MAALVNNYPVGVQTFEDIRRRELLYVDKTAYIWDLAHQGGKAFFLSRPRRFGKSLLISTMQAYFEGRCDLFQGLAIDRLETAWEARPVIRLDLSTVKTRDVEGLMSHLSFQLKMQEDRFGIARSEELPGPRLQALIQQVVEDTGKQAVILVDEYDAPLLNVVDEPELLEQFRQIMREFYIPLKACDADLDFVFLTGITKFSQLSIFSELNNLRNISMEPAFAAICGITEEELTGQMAQDIEKLAKKLGLTAEETFAELKALYDGYHFCGESPDIYNPFSLLNAFAAGSLGSYWFGSGTPTALLRLMDAYGWTAADLMNCEADADEFDAPTEVLDNPLPMLYQAGYLTIKSYDAGGMSYVLGVPNREVARGLAGGIVKYAGGGAFREAKSFQRRFYRLVHAGDMDGALCELKAYLAGIPYDLSAHDEKSFQSALYLIFNLTDIRMETEVRIATGRVDAVVRLADADGRDVVYVMEFKYGKSAAEAIAQIEEKRYDAPYRSDGVRVVKIGLSFSPEERTIGDWIIREG